MSGLSFYIEELRALRESVDGPFFQGTGLGSSAQVRRWAALGKFLDEPLAQGLILAGWLTYEARQIKAFEDALRRRPGRPGKQRYSKADCRRAFRLWANVQALKARGEKVPTIRQLIDIEVATEQMLPKESKGRIFQHCVESTLHQSVSRGRTALQIDDDWQSDTCVKLEQEISAISP